MISLQFLPLETDLCPKFVRLGKCCLILKCLTLPGWDNIFAPSFRAKYIMTSRHCHKHGVTIGSGAMAMCFVQVKRRWNRAFMKNNLSPHCEMDKGISSSCPWFATSTTRPASSWIANHGHSDYLQHPRLGQPRHGLQIMETRMGFPCPNPQCALCPKSPSARGLVACLPVRLLLKQNYKTQCILPGLVNSVYMSHCGDD